MFDILTLAIILGPCRFTPIFSDKVLSNITLQPVVLTIFTSSNSELSPLLKKLSVIITFVFDITFGKYFTLSIVLFVNWKFSTSISDSLNDIPYSLLGYNISKYYSIYFRYEVKDYIRFIQ